MSSILDSRDEKKNNKDTVYFLIILSFFCNLTRWLKKYFFWYFVGFFI